MRPLSRRAVLRGAGACLALPWLEGMAGATGTAPRRLLVVTIPNGMPPDAWRSAGTGALWTPGRLLSGLGDLTSQLTVLEGLGNAITTGEPHHACSLALLTGRETPPWAVSDPRTFVSMDQVTAAAIGGATRLPSLQLGSDPAVPCGEAAAGQQPTCAGYWTPAWADGNTPLVPEVDTRRAFTRLFGEDAGETAVARLRRQRYEQALVDRVREHAASLSARLGAADRARLDQYLTGVAELERALYAPPAPTTGACADARGAFLDHTALDSPVDVDVHVGVMLDLIVLALQCDLTRVITYALASERTDRTYPWLGVPEAHHHISHHGSDPVKLMKLETIGRWELDQVAALLRRLQATPDGDGTLLDSTTVLALCSMGEPELHDARDIPVFVAGGGLPARGRQVLTGQPLARLHLTLLQHLGVPVDRFGDAGDRALDVWS